MSTLSMILPAAAADAKMVLPLQQRSIDAALLPQIIEAYFEAKRGEIDPHTVLNYRNQLRPWLAFWQECEHIHNHTLSPEVLQAALKWMRTEYRNTKGQRPHPTSVRHCFVRLKQVFHWGEAHDCFGGLNLVAWCPIPPRRKPNMYFPMIEELALMLKQPRNEFRLRDVAMMAWMLSTGARVFETSNATVGNVHFNTPITDITVGQDHSGYVLLEKVKFDREGEGGGRYVAFDTTAGLVLKVYLRSVVRGPNDTIFGLTHSAITKTVSGYADALGLPEISPHAFRRAFADYWDEIHGAMGRMVLKLQLGHSLSKEDVTQRHYINNNNVRRILRELQRFHVSPLSEIQLDWEGFPVHIQPDPDSV